MVPLLRLASDERLAEYVCDGSERAFEVLYARHHRPVLAFCRHMLGSVEEAEDALQFTFMAAYRDLVRSGVPAAVRPWLFVIARNRCVSVLRARRELPAEKVPERASDRLAADVVVREELRAVFAGLARLPDDQRAALVLSELGDVTHDEIARILDCRREQVKSYVFQARSSLAADRVARDTPCAEIRAQLAAFRGGQLRRTSLRRHLDGCAGCREFRETLRSQRRQLRALLPVAPAVGLKRSVLGAVLTAGGGGAGTLGGLAATALLVIAIPIAGVAVARGAASSHSARPALAPAAVEAARASSGGPAASPPRAPGTAVDGRGSTGVALRPATPALDVAGAGWSGTGAWRAIDQPPHGRTGMPHAGVPGAAARDDAPASGSDEAPASAPEPASGHEKTSPTRAGGRGKPPTGRGQQSTPRGRAGARDRTPPGRTNGHAKTPPARANGRDPTPPGRAHDQDRTPPARATGHDTTPPGQANGHDKAPPTERGRASDAPSNGPGGSPPAEPSSTERAASPAPERGASADAAAAGNGPPARAAENKAAAPGRPDPPGTGSGQD